MKTLPRTLAALSIPALTVASLLSVMAGTSQARVYDETEWYGTQPYYNDYDDYFFAKNEGISPYRHDAYDYYTGHYYPSYYGRYIQNHYPSYYTHGDYTAFGPDLAPNTYGGGRFYGPYPRHDGKSTLYENPYGFDNYYYETPYAANSVNRIRNRSPYSINSVSSPSTASDYYTHDWYETQNKIGQWH